MIARIWRGATPARKGDAYTAYLQATGVRDSLATEGNRGAVLLRSEAADRTKFLFMTLWDSPEAIRRFAGPEISRARYYPEDEAYLLELEPTVEHYEVVRGLEGSHADAD